MDPRAVPPLVRKAIAAEIGDSDLRGMRRAYATLSHRYRTGRTASASYVQTPHEALAYVAVRAPATYAATRSVFAEVAVRLRTFVPASILDIGCGPGTATWAAIEQWPQIRRATLLDRDRRLLAMAHRIAINSGHASRVVVDSAALDVKRGSLPGAADLVSASYVLSELPVVAVTDVLTRMWGATRHTLVIVEPGTPRGFETVLAVRRWLLGAGAHLVAPCPSDGACPKAAPGRWCHFAARFPRDELHRQVKQTTLGYEDEKYSYVVASREPPTRPSARVTAMPKKASGVVILELCDAPGLRQQIVTRSDKTSFRRARRLTWGSPVE